MADTLSHTALFGVAVSFWLGTTLMPTVLVAAVVFALLIERLRRVKQIFGESVLSILLTASLALTMVLISLKGGYKVDLLSYLFGSITTVTRSDLFYIALLGTLIILAVLKNYRALFLASLSEELAATSGIAVERVNLLLILMTSLFVSVAMQVVGILLISGLLVIPVVTAMLWEQDFRKTLLAAISFSLFSVLTGLLLSYWFNIASGGAIILVACLLLVISLAGRRVHLL